MLPCHARRRLVRALALYVVLPGLACGADYDPSTPDESTAPAPPRSPSPAGGPSRPEQTGLASITRDRLEGFKTASGEPYSRNALAGAHRSLPFGTLVRVTNVQNRRSVLVRINDRSSAVGSRVVELTPRAAAVIGLQGIEAVKVKVEVIGASGVRMTNPGLDADVK